MTNLRKALEEAAEELKRDDGMGRYRACQEHGHRVRLLSKVPLDNQWWAACIICGV